MSQTTQGRAANQAGTSGKFDGQKISREQEQALITYATMAQSLLYSQFSLRDSLEATDRAYMRENDYTVEQLRARTANRLGNPTKFQNITVPIVMPQVQAALGYLTNVFLTGYPIFGVTADPAMEEAAMQMETIIAENAVTAGWARQLLMFFRDGLKYNFHALEVNWEQRTAATAINSLTSPTGVAPKNVLWNGNVIKRMDPYNTFFDPRVHPAEIHLEGEFAGYNEILSRVRLKKYINDLFGKVDPSRALRALESNYGNSGIVATGGAPFSYYQPIINPEPLMAIQNQIVFDWMNWATVATPGNRRGINYSNVFLKSTLYARIIPSDFGFEVPGSNTPQVWKFIIINGTVVLIAERLSNFHPYLPILFGQPLEDGLDFQTKSFADNVTPMQEVASAMINGYVASKRRLIGDRVLYDPLRVREADINSDNPSAKIPVRPAAYGKPVNEAVYAFPYREGDTGQFVQASDMALRFANMINGQNPAQQGQFVKGNKTLHEYDDVMGHGNAVNQMMAIATENQVFGPLKEILKLNILQFQGAATYYSEKQKAQVNIDPATLRNNAVQFKVSDGLLPKDKEMSGDEWMTALQVLGSSQQIGQGYNLSPMFSYLMNTRGADLTPFEKTPAQVQYEQALAAWEQAAIAFAKAGVPGEFKTPQPQPPPPTPTPPSGSQVALQSTQGASQNTRTQSTQPTPSPSPSSSPTSSSGQGS